MARDRIPTLGARIATLDTRKAKPLPKKAEPHYQTAEHEEWAEFIKKRAGYRCKHVEGGVRCWRSAEKGCPMYADHIQGIKNRPDLALDRSNGRCAWQFAQHSGRHRGSSKPHEIVGEG